jgi:hypothetical protein
MARVFRKCISPKRYCITGQGNELGDSWGGCDVTLVVTRKDINYRFKASTA